MSDCLSCVRRRRVLPEAQEVPHSNNRVAPAPQAHPIPTERFIRYGPRRDQVEIIEHSSEPSYLHLPADKQMRMILDQQNIKQVKELEEEDQLQNGYHTSKKHSNSIDAHTRKR